MTPSGDKPLRVAISAGEQSGDILGAGLIEAIREHRSSTTFEGIAGPRMQAAGCVSLYPMERLSVMGFTEVAGRYFSLMRDRASLVKHWLDEPPDIFIGIDAPDFNLGLARRLKNAGITTVHYVSPSVWAWRRYRVKGIRKSVDRMLTLFPFEADFYREEKVDVRHVGHRTADDIALHTDQTSSRASLELAQDATWVALLPGSRMSEVNALARLMFETAEWLIGRQPGLQFIVPAATSQIYSVLSDLANEFPNVPITVHDGESRTAMAAADVVLLASGTATLEAMLLKKPMVVTYKVHPITYRIMRALFTVSYVSLPNLLAKRGVVPELLQDEAVVEKLGPAVLTWFDDDRRRAALVREFEAIHETLRGGASDRAARAVLELVTHHG